MASLSRYFEAVRRKGTVLPLREASRRLFSDISAFLDELQVSHPMQGIEELKDVRNRQKLLVWLEDSIGTLCETLINPRVTRRWRVSGPASARAWTASFCP